MSERMTLAEWRETRAIARERRLDKLFRQEVTAFLIDPEMAKYRNGRGLDLDGACLRGETLADGYLVNFLLRGADLRDATIDRADLTGADLTGARLCGASLRDAILAKANLTDADLTGADLTGADLAGAILDGAVMPEGSGAPA